MDPYRIRATPERFKRLSEGRRRRLRVVRGHMLYGIHQLLPQGATYLTMLRDPVARLLSSYCFMLRRALQPMHRKFKREHLGVEDYIRLIPHRQNLQCRLSAAIGNGEACDERARDTADENFTRLLRVVGLCGRFKGSLMLMAKTFGCEVRFIRIKKF
jgi:hypothetical protein